jgi:hypothetical protein
MPCRGGEKYKYNLDSISPICYICIVWEVLHTPEFENWYLNQDEDAKTHILRDIKILSEIGPSLGRPLVDTLKNSKISNLKELRVQSNGRPFRIFFLFDPKRNAVILIGGNKKGIKKFYETMIAIAENIYTRYLRR